MELHAVMQRGLKKGLAATWDLSRIVVPIYILVTLISHTPLMGFIARLCEPFMKLVGLPGEAAIVLVLGLVVNIYASLGSLASIPLSGKEITIISMMVLIAHSIPVEWAIARKTGVNGFVISLFRMILALVVAAVLNIVL